MTYICSPYSHPSPAIRQASYEAACQATANLLRQGRAAVSPIVHSYFLVQYGLPTDFDFWSGVDLELLRRCDDVLVLMLDGWKKSRGVKAEVAEAVRTGKEVRYVKP